MKTEFEKYVNCVRKSAHYYADKYRMDYEDLEAEGFKIYLEALESYQPEKSSFITHLTWELKRLNYYCIKEKSYSQPLQSIEDCKQVERISDSRMDNPTLEYILDFARKSLSRTAYRILDWILSRSWERKNVLKPTINLAVQNFGMKREQVIPYWNEIKSFYQNYIIN